jgi:hypothetical protein
MKLLKLALVGMVASSMLMASHGEGKKAQKQKQASEYKKIVHIGNEASQKLLKTLGGNLKKHMKAGGPMEAFTFCSGHARELTDEVNAQLPMGVKVKRITLKPRNPLNEAKGDERTILEALDTLNRNGVRLPSHLVQKTADGYRYYKPLKIGKKVCLKCHGTHIDPKLDEQIKKVYKMDKARGYKMGDLRGAIVVDIKQ